MSISIHWSSGEKLLFRFIFVFFGLIIFPFPLNTIPGVSGVIEQIWAVLVSWVGSSVLDIRHDFSLKATGSGDKLFDWVYYLIVLVLALVSAVVWSVADRRRANYERLQKWFLLFLTYYVAYIMFIYGIIKIFYLQFMPPNLERLFHTFGQSSPMHLMWTFMGFSQTYTVFAGACETTAGIFLLFRRTRTLGGLVTFGVMLNVFMLNMSYDIPVKLFSFQLMIMGLYIALLDYKRLFNVFLLNKPAPAYTAQPVFNDKKRHYVVIGLQILLGGYFIISQIMGSMEGRKQYGIGRAKSPLYGIYDVETFVRNNDTLPPLTTYSTRWKHLLMDYPNSTSVIMMDGSIRRYQSEIDTAAQTIVIDASPNKYVLKYEQDEEDMLIAGELMGDSLRVELENYPLENFGLLNRGFHWVNEVPYNRYNYER